MLKLTQIPCHFTAAGATTTLMQKWAKLSLKLITIVRKSVFTEIACYLQYFKYKVHLGGEHDWLGLGV